MKKKKIVLTPLEESIMTYLFADIFAIIAWNCTLTEPSIMREQLEEIVWKRLHDIFYAELSAFAVRLSQQVICDLDLPRDINLYGFTPYIPSDPDKKAELVQQWMMRYRECQTQASSSRRFSSA